MSRMQERRSAQEGQRSAGLRGQLCGDLARPRQRQGRASRGFEVADRCERDGWRTGIDVLTGRCVGSSVPGGVQRCARWQALQCLCQIPQQSVLGLLLAAGNGGLQFPTGWRRWGCVIVWPPRMVAPVGMGGPSGPLCPQALTRMARNADAATLRDVDRRMLLIDARQSRQGRQRPGAASRR
jgi:hypothetical protein